MFRSPFVLAVASILAQQVSGLGRLEFCADGIQSTMGYFAFVGDNPDDYWANICANDLRVLSMGAAVRSYCSTQETVRGWNVLQDYCTDNAYHLADWDALGTNLTDAFTQSLHIVQFEDIAAGDTWNESVLISPTLYATAYRTTVCDVLPGTCMTYSLLLGRLSK